MVAKSLTSENRIDFALQLLEDGWPVLPLNYPMPNGSCSCGNPNCHAIGKHPVKSGGIHNATNDAAAIRQEWMRNSNFNIGLATGAISGMIAIDIDGFEAAEGLAEVESRIGVLPDTRRHTTGKDGGQHRIFRTPHGIRIKNSVGRIASSVDVRGDNGYIVGPGSKHASGRMYRVENPETPIAELPEAWLKMIQGTEGGEIPPPVHVETNSPIYAGERDDRLFKIGSRLRGDGATFDAILDTLRRTNLERCQPPLDDAQVVQKARQAYGKETNSELRAAPHTDVGNAERLIAVWGGRIRYGIESGQWYAWDGLRFRANSHGLVQRFAQQTIRDTYHDARNPDKHDGPLEMWALQSEKGNGIGRMVGEAAVIEPIPVSDTEFDGDPYLLNLENGILDLQPGEKFGRLLAHDPKYMMTMRANVAFDADATAPRFEEFVNEILQGDSAIIEYMQQVLGVMLTGDTSDQRFWIAHGGGANGKSTLFNVMCELLGDYAAEAPFKWFDGDSSGGKGDDMYSLRGKRFVKVSEADSDRRINESRLKGITGGDRIKCRPLYGRYIEYTPQFKIAIAVNHRPEIPSNDHGTWRRIVLVPFERRFEGDQIDRRLDGKLRAEFPGILNWLIEGVRIWHERGGLIEPDVLIEATGDYRAELDTIGQWLDERCDVEESASVESAMLTPAQELYADYKAWFSTRGRFELSEKAFANRMVDRGLRKKRTKRGQAYVGIALKPLAATWKDGAE